MKRIFFLGLSFILVVAMTGCGKQNKPPSLAPDFTLSLFNNEREKLTLSEIVKEHPVLLVFWASWCPTCVSEIPTLNEWYGKYSATGLQILAVNVQEPRDQILKFAEKTPLRYPSLVDEDGEVASRYGLVGLPVSLFLAKGGEIIYYGFGLPDNLDQLLTRN